MTKNADMPAYPLTEEQIDRSERGNGYEGLSKREEFAKAAMIGLLASGKFQVDGEMCREAWSAADQMFWQQEKDQSK